MPCSNPATCPRAFLGMRRDEPSHSKSLKGAGRLRTPRPRTQAPQLEDEVLTPLLSLAFQFQFHSLCTLQYHLIIMATVAAPSPRQHTRRRPFQWMKRLVKNTSPNRQDKKHSKSNNPYPESGSINPHRNTLRDNVSEYSSVYSGAATSHNIPPRSTKSAAPTLATNAETVHSEAGVSKTGTTSNTIGSGQNGGGNSTFSSPNHSERSLTTTLTTIQSTAPSALLNTNTAASQTAGQNPGSAHNSIGFSPYPASSPASAVPPHLQNSQLHPNTYSAATGKASLGSGKMC